MVISSEIDGPSEECTTQNKITDALVNAHIRKYQAAWQNPPLNYPIKEIIGKYGVTKHTKNILKGTFRPVKNANKHSNMLLQNMHGLSHDNIPIGISRRDYQEGWKKMKERTSAGGFLHFGHCKAIAKDDELSDIEAAFISIPLKSGCACPH